MDVLDPYVYSINFDNSVTFDREHSPYFCNQETPKLPDPSPMTNNNSFEFSQGFNPGLTLDKYFGSNFKAIPLKEMEVDETFEIYTRSSKNRMKNKSCHYRNESRNNVSGLQNDLSMELILEQEEAPLKDFKKAMLNTKKSERPSNEVKKSFGTEVLIKDANDRPFQFKNGAFKRTFVQNNKSMSPCLTKEDPRPQKENMDKPHKITIKEKEVLKKYQLEQFLKRENPENHIAFRKIAQFTYKKNQGFMQKADPLAEYTDLGLAKNIGKIKNSMQIEKKAREAEGRENQRMAAAAKNMLGIGRNKGYSKTRAWKNVLQEKES